MSATFDRVRERVKLDDWYGSDHALVRLEENGIDASELADRIDLGLVIEDYPAIMPARASWSSRRTVAARSTPCGA